MKRIIGFAVLVTVIVAVQLVPQDAVAGELAPSPALAGEQRAVLITGASTGIGRNMAERLANEGFFVYAGARKDKDLAELSALDNIMGVRIDVTSQEQVDAAVALIREEGRGLYALVNNAGVASTGPVAAVQDSEFDFVFDVNVKGVMRVTRAFLPLLAEHEGRVVTTGSVAGIGSGRAGSVYSMSKHAVEAFTDSLAAEMADTGVQVSVIEPGSYKSRIRRTTIGRIAGQIEAAGGTVSEDLRKRAKELAEEEVSLDEPDDVSTALMHALSAEVAYRRYLVTPTAEQAERTIRSLIRELVELNQWEQRRLSRDELTAILDEELAAQGASD